MMGIDGKCIKWSSQHLFMCCQGCLLESPLYRFYRDAFGTGNTKQMSKEVADVFFIFFFGGHTHLRHLRTVESAFVPCAPLCSLYVGISSSIHRRSEPQVASGINQQGLSEKFGNMRDRLRKILVYVSSIM